MGQSEDLEARNGRRTELGHEEREVGRLEETMEAQCRRQAERLDGGLVKDGLAPDKGIVGGTELERGHRAGRKLDARKNDAGPAAADPWLDEEAPDGAGPAVGSRQRRRVPAQGRDGFERGGHIEELSQSEGRQSRDDGPAEDGPGHCAILAGDKLDFVGVEASQGLPT